MVALWSQCRRRYLRVDGVPRVDGVDETVRNLLCVFLLGERAYEQSNDIAA